MSFHGDDDMARPEITGRKPLADQAAFTIAEFCLAHRISQSMYFKMRNLGLGPREMAVGRRTLISVESAADWRREREADAATETVEAPEADHRGFAHFVVRGRQATRRQKCGYPVADRAPHRQALSQPIPSSPSMRPKFVGSASARSPM